MILINSGLRFQWYETHLYPNFCPGRSSCWQYYTVLRLTRFDLYCFGVRIQKIVLYCLCRLRTNYVRSNNLKSDPHLPKEFCFISFIESPLKMMKNAFYFILKTLLVLKIFKFLSWLFWSCWKNSLIRKIRLISKFIKSQPG